MRAPRRRSAAAGDGLDETPLGRASKLRFFAFPVLRIMVQRGSKLCYELGCNPVCQPATRRSGRGLRASPNGSFRVLHVPCFRLASVYRVVQVQVAAARQRDTAAQRCSSGCLATAPMVGDLRGRLNCRFWQHQRALLPSLCNVELQKPVILLDGICAWRGNSG